MAPFIYLDHNATTPVDPDVLNEMIPYFSEQYGNAGSINHPWGKKAAAAVHRARTQLANLLNVTDDEITFTSGATEAINLAIKGIFSRYTAIGKHIITCQTEHKAVLDVCQFLEKKGAEITYLPVDSQGQLDLMTLKNAIREDTILISIMYANNETGSLHPIAEIAKIAQEHGVLFFCDATQAVGKIPIFPAELGIDMMAFSAHKLYGPKGIGALYIKKKSRRIQLEAQLHGGSQEKQLRAGTLNVPAIVGFGAAMEKAMRMHQAESRRLKDLRDYLERELLSIEQTFLNGSLKARLSHVCNVSIRHLKAEQLLASMPGLAISTGSACSTGSLEPSHVLLAMGLDKQDAHAAIRISLGRFTSEEEVESALLQLRSSIDKLRAQSPIWMLYKKGLLESS